MLADAIARVDAGNAGAGGQKVPGAGEHQVRAENMGDQHQAASTALGLVRCFGTT